MNGQLKARWSLALTGALGGIAFWALIEVVDGGWIEDRLAMMLGTLVVTGFGAALAMAGPIGLLQAAIRGLGLGVVTALLVGLVSLRYANPDDIFNTAMPALATTIVAALPVPFLIAQARPGWSDYPALFLEAWSIVVRYAAALAFTGLVWLVIYLSDEVLQIVGVTLIGDLLDYNIVPLVVTGFVLGLGMAVVHELADLLSPYLVLRLFRLLLPVVLGVMLVFLVALPFRGLDGLFQDLSPALLLLAMVAGGVSLVSIAIDRSNDQAAASPVLRRSAQGMALVLPVLAGLALWALGLRVGQHGWTPERLFLALTGLIGLGYGLVYAVAVVRGPGWMQRIRRGNLWMAVAGLGAAVLWLTPILNAEAISARNQLARFEAGKTPVAELDVRALELWGKPGEAVIAKLEDRAKEPGQEALAAQLAGETLPDDTAHAAKMEALAAILPVQPANATGTRDMLLAAAEDYNLTDWHAACSRVLDSGAPACVLVIADLLPSVPGEEGVLILERSPDYVEALGLYLGPNGDLVQRSMIRTDGSYMTTEEAATLLRAAQAEPQPLTPALLNQLGTGPTGLVMLP
jgi:Domain of unknown function (DUF4153)